MIRKIDQIYNYLKELDWFKMESMDRQGWICNEIAKHLSAEASRSRFAVLDAVQAYEG